LLAHRDQVEDVLLEPLGRTEVLELGAAALGAKRKPVCAMIATKAVDITTATIGATMAIMRSSTAGTAFASACS
jgi:hypothetical protein